MKARILTVAFFAAATVVSMPFMLPIEVPGQVAQAEDAWKTEMDTVCSKTQDAMTMSTEELKSLVERCDKLKPIIEGLDETMSKVYGKRLQMCRDLYAFVIESRVNPEK